MTTKDLDLSPVAEIPGATSAEVDPLEMGLEPVLQSFKLLIINNFGFVYVDLIEINEVFAAPVLAVETVTLMHSLSQEKKEFGPVTLF